MNQKFMDFMRAFYGKKMAVAVSGGVDSVALLHWLVEIGADIVCLHVNHGLRAAADTESEYVRDLCKKLNVPCEIFYWTGDKPESGLEAAARAARYKMMTDFCNENGIEYLLTAHQADDQIETFLMNLGRGSGVFGLATMRAVAERDGVKIVRPLLNISREELQSYCDARGIKYFTDEMNSDNHYTRVRIRQNRHLLRDKLGISDDRILLAIENLGRVRGAVDTDVDNLVADVMGDGFAMFRDSFLFDLAGDIRLKFIGTLIQKIGGDDYQPRLNSLQLALNNLHGNCKFTLGHCTVRRLGERILIVPEGAKTTFRKRHGKNKQIKK
jgi:tRNA(Ile)-lysidine synthase